MYLNKAQDRGKTFRLSPLTYALISTLCISSTASAVSFDFGEVEGSFDSTFTLGGQWRVSSRDQSIISQANGGRNGLDNINSDGDAGDGSANIDDGNLNYDTGLISSAFKGTHELSLNWRNYGLFVRARYFYDSENKDRSRDRRANIPANPSPLDADLYSLIGNANTAISSGTIIPGLDGTPRNIAANLAQGENFELSDQAEDSVGADFEFLDVFFSASYDVGNIPLDFRLGQQVVSWGESTFIQNGINVINPINVPALRLPGAEIKEGLLPVNMLWSAVGLTDNLTLEGFYQFDWEEFRVDEPGTYFATNDFVGNGGRFVTISGLDECTDNSVACTIPNTVSRASDDRASDGGQFGLALRWYAEGLNNTEFGLYFLNYHSRRPLISAFAADVDQARFATLFSATSERLSQGILLDQGVPAAIVSGLDPSNGEALAFLSGLNADVANGVVTASSFASANASIQGGAQYFIEYPENINLFGLSFNTNLDAIGLSLSGEISYRPNAPVQIDDQELLQAALSSIPGPLGANQASRSQYNAVFNGGDPLAQGERIQGYIDAEVTQLQTTAIQVFGPTLGASQFSLVGEIGLTHVSLPDQADLLIEATGASDDGQDRGERDFATQTSWGYRIRGRLDYNNFFAGWNMSPSFAFSHDVKGITPAPISNFLEDRKAVSLGLGFEYQQRFGVDFGYTNFFGAGHRNLINDRDFVSAALRYSF